jgi:uroporphyrinogen-III synthase
MSDPGQTNSELEAVLEELAETQGFDAIEARLAEIAPQLQNLLDGALRAGGWFDDAHEAVVLKTATQPDADQRIAELRNFVLEQTRLGMLVGVAVGWELAERLEAKRSGPS